MNRAELIEKVAEDIELFGSGIDARHAAKIIIDTIFAAMLEPTEAMQLKVSANWGRRTWAEYHEVLSASPLAPEGAEE